MALRVQRAPYPILSILIAFLALGWFFVGPTDTCADDGAIENVGGAARLMEDQGRIRMVAETVRARVSAKKIEVDCVFVFENRGPADTVLIGFPDFSYGDVTGRPMREFRSWVDGVEVKCDTIADANDGLAGQMWNCCSYWWTKRVAFAAGATRTVRDHYVAEPGSDVAGVQGFDYILHTGASWAGTIGKADITVTLRGIPPSWIRGLDSVARLEGNQLHWSFRDFEPGSDDGSPASISFSWWSPQRRSEWEKRYPPD